MSDLTNLLERLQSEISQTEQHYVYYDSDTYEIYKISPSNKEHPKYECFAIDSNFVEPILSGAKKLSDFIVCYDYAKKSNSIRLAASNNFTNVYLQEITENIPYADLSIELDNCIKFSVDSKLLDHIQKDKSNLIFVLTEANNPYKIYQTFNFPAKDLNANSIKFDLKYQVNNLDTGVSIYTNKVFDTYSVKVINDTKIQTN